MKNNTRSTLLFPLLFLATSIFAQEKFSPYVVHMEWDTIWGEIGTGDFDEENQIFSFYNLKDSLVEYSVPQINSIYFNGRFFKKLETENEEPPKLFEAIVVSENLSLFYFEKAKNNSTFILEKNGETIKLMPPNQLKKWDKRIDEFMHQLSKALTECPDFENTIYATSYSAKSLKRTLVAYLDCLSEEYDYMRNVFVLGLNIGPALGYNSSDINFGGRRSIYRDILDTKFKNSNDPYVGLFLELKPKLKFKHWSLFNELGFFAANYQSIDFNISFDEYANFSFLELSHRLRFQSASRGADIFLEAGGGNQYMLRQDVPLLPVEERDGVFKNNSQFLIIGIGIKSGLISAALHYKKGNGLTKIEDLTASDSSIRFVVRFDFF